MERGWKEMAPNCPRCGSTNTKFCYYNNYSLTQPRYFCKGCRRYWTKGGSLRNVPVGGGCRKSRRANKPSLRTASVATTTTPYPNCRRAISEFGHSVMRSDGRSSSSSSPASTIDLAVVYANFLKLKGPQEGDENHRAHLAQNHTYHDHLISPPLDMDSCADLDLSYRLSNPVYLGDQGDQLYLLHNNHHHHKPQDHSLIQNPSSLAYERISESGALLPPLPDVENLNTLDHHQLISSSNDHHNPESNALQSTMHDPLEAEAQFSSLFNVDTCWSPFDFSGYSDIQTPVVATSSAPVGSLRQQFD